MKKALLSLLTLFVVLGAVVAQEKALDFTLDYRCALPYRDWMADAVLNMKQDFCNCGGHERQVYVERLLDKLPVPPPAPVVTPPPPESCGPDVGGAYTVVGTVVGAGARVVAGR